MTQAFSARTPAGNELLSTVVILKKAAIRVPLRGHTGSKPRYKLLLQGKPSSQQSLLRSEHPQDPAARLELRAVADSSHCPSQQNIRGIRSTVPSSEGIWKAIQQAHRKS